MSSLFFCANFPKQWLQLLCQFAKACYSHRITGIESGGLP